MIAVELGVSVTMLILEPPAPTRLFPTLERVVLACNTTPLGVVAPLAFDFLLIALCTLYAIKTRNVPENFNEAKFIGFAMERSVPFRKPEALSGSNHAGNNSHGRSGPIPPTTVWRTHGDTNELFSGESILPFLFWPSGVLPCVLFRIVKTISLIKY
ncbi:Metabotropic glutamate receptor 1 [Blattella germanica]|nr:Metabotropic glutamate receptor 1 [Blattella germanica]